MEIINENTAAPHNLSVGDKVGYVPHTHHAMRCDVRTGDLPWVFGRKIMRRGLTAKDPMEEVTIELNGQQLEAFLFELKNSPNREQKRKELVFLRPTKLWNAVVTAVNDNGTVDLDVESNQAGFTLHEKNIAVSGRKTLTVDTEWVHHTCCKLEN
jgi:hypothetical protein